MKEGKKKVNSDTRIKMTRMRLRNFKGTAVMFCCLCTGLVVLLVSSCATPKPVTVEVEKRTEISEEIGEEIGEEISKGISAGVEGTVIPVDSSGDEIVMQDKEKIIVNCIPINNGTRTYNRSTTGNSNEEGSFGIDLKDGKYLIEVFLEGFYVKSFTVTLAENQRIDLGEIKIERIESGSGIPMKGDEIEEVFGSEGDVNIQPPSS